MQKVSAYKKYEKGEIIKIENLAEKKPSNGINPKYKNKILGKKLKENIKFNQLFKWSHFE